MVDTGEASTLAILTFWVGPFLLGVEADQIVRLPSPPGKAQRLQTSAQVIVFHSLI